MQGKTEAADSYIVISATGRRGQCLAWLPFERVALERSTIGLSMVAVAAPCYLERVLSADLQDAAAGH